MPKLNVSNSDTTPINIHYQTFGNPNAKQKIIFISGLGAICSQWDYQVEYFSKQDDYQICVFDNRGAGFSDAPPGKYTTTMLADDALTLINYLRWDSLNLVGLSMGGMIAQELAFKLEKRVASLALLSTYSKFNGLPAFGNFKLSEPLKILDVIKQLASAPPPKNTPMEFAAHTADINFPEEWLNDFSKEHGKEHLTNRDVVIEWQAERYTKTGLQSAVGRAGQANACLSHWFDRRLDVLAQYPYPKLVVAGDQDYILRQPASSLYLAKRLKAFLMVYPNGGHNIRVQDPEWLNEQLHLHFKKAKSAPKSYDLIPSVSCESFVTAELDESEDEIVYF